MIFQMVLLFNHRVIRLDLARWKFSCACVQAQMSTCLQKLFKISLCSYTEKMDCFSFGVITLQILT